MENQDAALNETPITGSEAEPSENDLNSSTSSPPPVPEEFRKEQTGDPTSTPPTSESEEQPQDTTESAPPPPPKEPPITPEVVGFEGGAVIQKAIDEIMKCRDLHQLSDQSTQIIGMALNQLAPQIQGGFLNFQ